MIAQAVMQEGVASMAQEAVREALAVHTARLLPQPPALVHYTQAALRMHTLRTQGESTLAATCDAAMTQAVTRRVADAAQRRAQQGQSPGTSLMPGARDTPEQHEVR